MNNSKKSMVAGVWLAFRETLEAYDAPDQVIESVREAARSLNMSTEELEYIKKEWVFCEGYKRIFNMIFEHNDDDDDYDEDYERYIEDNA